MREGYQSLKIITNLEISANIFEITLLMEEKKQ